jgi:predicted Zn-dependent peptidase
LAQTFAELDFFGLDESEVNNYFARLDAISLEDTRRIIDRYYPLDDLVFVLIGKAAEIRSKVQKYAVSIDQRPISKPGFN